MEEETALLRALVLAVGRPSIAIPPLLTGAADDDDNDDDGLGFPEPVVVFLEAAVVVAVGLGTLAFADGALLEVRLSTALPTTVSEPAPITAPLLLDDVVAVGTTIWWWWGGSMVSAIPWPPSSPSS